MDANKIETMKAQRVEACIADVMARFPGESKATQARYFEEVHQHLAPLARQLECECDTLRAEVERLRAELAAGAAKGGDTSESAGLLDHAKTAETRMNSGFEGGHLGLAPAAGTVETDSARYRWLKERFTGYDFYWGGTAPYEDEADKGKCVIVFECGQDFSAGRNFEAGIDAAMAHTKGKDAA